MRGGVWQALAAALASYALGARAELAQETCVAEPGMDQASAVLQKSQVIAAKIALDEAMPAPQPSWCKVWFDGCNECTNGSCTEMACNEYKKPACREAMPAPQPSWCKVWFDGCNECKDGSCKVWCDEYQKPACREAMPAPQPSWCKVWFDGCNECTNGSCTEMACNEYQKPACREAPPTMPPPPCALPCGGGCLEAVQAAQCPSSPHALSKCDQVEAGEFCEGDGECGTSSSLNNCDVFDVYRKSGNGGACPTDRKGCPDGTLVNRDPATCNFPPCPESPGACRVHPVLSSECPQRLHWLNTCDKVQVGEFCEGDGECGTSQFLNNCGDSYDVYRRDT